LSRYTLSEATLNQENIKLVSISSYPEPGTAQFKFVAFPLRRTSR